MGTNEAGGCLRARFSSHACDTGTSKSWVAHDAQATNVNINILSLHESRERIACVSKILRLIHQSTDKQLQWAQMRRDR